jgi:phosphatidate phosphatase PAH1
MKNRNHLLIFLLTVWLVGSCASIPGEIPAAPMAQTPAVVFDIDGTLTPRPVQFYEARPDAAKAAQLYADKGYQIVYLSARRNYERAATLRWLKEHHFPGGITRVAETTVDGQHPAEFKTRILNALFVKGWRVDYAYGDSSTDFAAYAAVAIPPDHVFGLRRAGSRHCQPGPTAACLHGWTEHLDFIAHAVPAAAEK